MTGGVVCLGILVADVFAWPVDAMPVPGSLALTQGTGVRAGGCALNTATVLARFGVDVTLAGVVGNDMFGAFLADTIAARDLDAHIVRSTHYPTSTSLVLVRSDGERTFLHHPGANEGLTEDTFGIDTLATAQALHLGGALLMPSLDGHPAARLLARLRARGIHTSIDTAFDASGQWKRVLPVLPHTDLATVGWAEGCAITGERDPQRIADVLHRHGCPEVVIKMGANGSYSSGPGGQGHHAAIPVETVDGTGTGDAFAAGLLYGRVAGWPTADAVRLATAAGAMAASAVGAVEGVTGLADALRMGGLAGGTRR
jgi:sugar/nucleoside kinase (ribokinase family)